MIDLETVENEINKIEVTCDTSFRACERLAWLYIVRDNLARKREREGTTMRMGGSEFLELASGVSYQSLMQVLDEHMQALSVLQPRSYETIINKLRELRR